MYHEFGRMQRFPLTRFARTENLFNRLVIEW